MNYGPLSILDVVDRGVPNSERVPIRVEAHCALGNFWLGIGLRQDVGRVFPINDNLFWLGNGYLTPGDWIFVYSGRGAPRRNAIPNQPNTIYTMHWNRSEVLFQSEELHPILITGHLNTPPAFDEQARRNAMINALVEASLPKPAEDQ